MGYKPVRHLTLLGGVGNDQSSANCTTGSKNKSAPHKYKYHIYASTHAFAYNFTE